MALQLADGSGSVIHLLNVPEWPKADDALGISAGAPAMDVAREEVVKRGEDLLAELSSQVASGTKAKVVPLVLLGDPAETILEEAERLQVEAIVMGGRGLSDLKGLVVGSVSHKVMHAAGCRTIIVN